MAQRGERRKRRSTPRSPRPPAGRRAADLRRTRLRRVVVAFLVIVGLAGIVAISAPPADGDGHPPGRAPVG